MAMNCSRTKLEKIINIRQELLTNKDKWSYINYLDTGNIKNNVIFAMQKFIVGVDQIPSRAKRKVCIGDIIYSTVRPNQRHFGIIKKKIENMIVSTGFVVMSAKNEIADNRFILNFLSQDSIVNKLQAIAEHSTSTYPAIRGEDILNLIIELPIFEEQKKIADVLGSLDDKIELNNKMNKTLEDMAKAIFKSWFVDFDIVKAKQAKTPKKTVMTDFNISEEVYDLFPNSFEDSKLGQIPNGWKINKLANHIKFVKGKKPVEIFIKSKHGYMPQILMSSFEGAFSGYADPDNMILVRAEDIIMVMDGASSGRIFIGHNGILGSTLSKIVIDKRLNSLIYSFLKMRESDIQENTTGTSIPHTDKNKVNNYNIVIPSNLLLEQFNIVFYNLISRLQFNEKQNQKLSEMRDYLLPRLISGKVRVN